MSTVEATPPRPAPDVPGATRVSSGPPGVTETVSGKMTNAPLKVEIKLTSCYPPGVLVASFYFTNFWFNTYCICVLLS